MLASLGKAVQGVRILGARRSLQVLLFSLGKARLDWAYHRAGRHRARLCPPLAGPPSFESCSEPVWRPGEGFSARLAGANLEVRFLTTDLVRVTWRPGKDPVPYAIARDEWPSPEVVMEESAEGWRLSSADLDVVIGRDGTITFFDPTGQVLREEAAPSRDGDVWTGSARLRPEERVHGLGERAAPFDLRGGRYRMANAGPGGVYGVGRDPLYMCIPVVMGIHSAGSYLVFHENSHRGEVSIEDVAETRFEGGALRYYFIPGPPRRALERYSELTGCPPLPPAWALGYHQARWGYRSQQMVREVLEGFRQRNLPLSGIHLDVDWMDDYRAFTPHPERFGDLKALAADLGEAGVRLTVIIDPGLQRNQSFPLFREAEQGGRLCTLPDCSVSFGVQWPGWVGYPDVTDPEVRTWWGSQYRGLLDAGVVGFWHDLNEPVSFAVLSESGLPAPTRYRLEGRWGDHWEAGNVYGLAIARAAAEGVGSWCPGRRPFLLSRSGWAGIQRYAWSWTGDTESCWSMLHQTVATLLGLAMSGVCYSGPDIGGFRGAPSPELYVRWLQLSCFLPLFRTHSALDAPPREPWLAAGPYIDVVAEYLRFRYRLLPYLYTLAWEASRTGHPFVRPLFWPDGREPWLWGVDDAFCLGDALLVAPVVREGARERVVRLPNGCWYDLWEAKALTGGRDVAVSAPLERIPVFVRAGSILPLDDNGELVLEVYLPEQGGEGAGTLYRDAGDGYGPGRVEHFSTRWEQGRLLLEAAWEGNFVPDDQALALRLVGAGLRGARVDGVEVAVQDGCVRTAGFALVELDVDPDPDPDLGLG